MNTTEKPNKDVAEATQLVAVIKNGHTDAELEEMGERWVKHEGPYLTIDEIIAIEQAKQAKEVSEETELLTHLNPE